MFTAWSAQEVVDYLFRHIRRDDGGYGDCEIWPFTGFFVFPLVLELEVTVVPSFDCRSEILGSASPLLTSAFLAFFLVI
jgi:hypothetical protein